MAKQPAGSSLSYEILQFVKNGWQSCTVSFSTTAFLYKLTYMKPPGLVLLINALARRYHEVV